MMHSRAALLAQGFSDGAIRAQLKRGELVRLAAGMYAAAADLEGWPDTAYRLHVMAAARRSQAIVSHISAAVLHGLPLGGADLSKVHLIRPGKGGFRGSGGHVRHAGVIDPRWVTSVEGVLVTTAARTVVDLARSEPANISVPAMDNALYRRLCTPAEIREALGSVVRHRGAPRARLAAGLADGRAESPPETTVRLALAAAGLPPMELQFDVYDELGNFVGRGDGGYPERGLVWEYDGRGKYSDLLPLGTSALDALMAEKRRERGFVELGWLVVRADSTDLARPARFTSRIGRGLAATSVPSWSRPRGSVVLRAPLKVW